MRTGGSQNIKWCFSRQPPTAETAVQLGAAGGWDWMGCDGDSVGWGRLGLGQGAGRLGSLQTLESSESDRAVPLM